jgi:hypothetical protein
MPKSLLEYTAADWCRLRPLTQTVKSWRYRRHDTAYRRRAAMSGDIGAVAASIQNRRVLVTVAFCDPEVLSWQVQLVRRYVPGAVHVIVDNSSTNDAASDNARVAGAAGVAYLRAPPNPWSGRAASRSHGIVLNWAWHNLIRPGTPVAFGFLDHDIFPTAVDDPFEALAHQDVFGVVRTAGPRWFLWAGFCFFRFASVEGKPLDFGQDWFLGLDTGGGNWTPLYSRMDRGSLREVPASWVPFKPGIAADDGPLMWCGTWLHEVGLTGDPNLVGQKRAAVARLLAPHLDDAVSPAAIGVA